MIWRASNLRCLGLSLCFVILASHNKLTSTQSYKWLSEITSLLFEVGQHYDHIARPKTGLKSPFVTLDNLKDLYPWSKVLEPDRYLSIYLSKTLPCRMH